MKSLRQIDKKMLKEVVSPIFLLDSKLALSDEQEGVLSTYSAWFEMMQEKRLWFKERTPEDLNEIIPQLQSLAQDKTMLPGKALATLVGDGLVKADLGGQLPRALWNEVLLTVQAVTSESVPDSGRFKVCQQVTERLTRGIALSLLKPPGFEDGYIDVFAFYEAGVALLEFKDVEVNENGIKDRKLVAHFPLHHKGDRRLACLVLPDDNEVRFVHRWREGCNEIKPLVTPRQIRERNKD